MSNPIQRGRLSSDTRDDRSAQASPRVLLALLLLVLVPLIGIAGTPPSWWTSPDVINGSANDYAAINQGQLKNLVTKAYIHLQANLPTSVWTTTQGTNLSGLINSFQPNSPYNYSAVNLGQLKTVAKPFYDVLNTVGYTNTAVASPYPWSGLESSANDYAMANIGQAKNLFSFDLAHFTSEPPLPPGDVTATRNSDGTVEITWTDNSTNETGFTIFRSDDNGATWTAVVTTQANITAYTLPAANAGSASSLYQLIAAGAMGNSPPTNPTPGTPPKPAPRYAVIDLGSDHTHVMKIANSGHILAYGNGTSIAGWRWYNDEWSALTHSEENGSVIDMNNSGTVLGSCARSAKGWKETYHIVSIKAATWEANSTTAALSSSATGSAYYNGVLVSEGGAPEDPVNIREPFGIDDNGAVYSCDVSGDNPHTDPPPSSVFTDYDYTLGSGSQNVHKTNILFGGDFPIRIGPVCTAGYVQCAEPDYEYTYEGATLDFTPIDINNDGAVVGDTSIFHGGSTETLPATALAINNRHYPPGDTGASDWQIISDTTLIEKERNDDGSPGANYKSIPITDLIDRASTQTYSGVALNDINDHGVIVARAKKNNADHAILLLPAELAVDANRDGTIKFGGNSSDSDVADKPTDTTTQDKPFRFWCNDGQNVAEDQAALSGSQVTTANYTLGQINFKGDLENFARLWMYIGGLQQAIHDGNIKIGFKWKNTTGTPAVNIYKAFEADGGKQYLEDDANAASQIGSDYKTAVATVSGTTTAVLDKSVFTNLSDTNKNTYFLFEGAGVGKGQLVIVFLKSDGTEMGEGPGVWLNLKTVTDMFQQAQVTPSGQTDIPAPYLSFPEQPSPPAVAWTNVTSSNFEHPSDETKQCVVLVHGWNVTNGRYTQQSTECFKRLWWQGYKGLYASIRWPGDLTGADQSSWWSTAQNAMDYFEIEYRALKYGQSLVQYTSYLNQQGYSVGVAGHSMGNIVSSEAMKQGGNFTYALMDGAVSARCYDTSSGLLFTGITFNPPDLSSSGGYGAYFSGLGGLTSFYNTQDPALQSWESGNAILKGQTDSIGKTYVFTSGVGVRLKYQLSANTNPSYRDVFSNGQTNYHESMTMYAQTRTAAVGRVSTSGSIANPIDMQQNYFPGAAAHSPQFDYNIQHGPMSFYNDLLNALNFN
ncbi:MAG: hypothetical protein B9S32_03055 [Verrucomicrobia bacterium Tous-C9LFEB]|nr:MAG: hypothetical protein B9S32_03055 [Verrucomicrobia bacterium Tous-C9LFEB]